MNSKSEKHRRKRAGEDSEDKTVGIAVLAALCNCSICNVMIVLF